MDLKDKIKQTFQKPDSRTDFIIAVVLLLAVVYAVFLNTASAEIMRPEPVRVGYVGDKIFAEEGMQPGDKASETFYLSNESLEAKDVYINAEYSDGSMVLAEYLVIKIKNEEMDVYEGTLSDFFEEDNVLIATVERDEKTEHEISVLFNPGTEDINSVTGDDVEFNFALYSQPSSGNVFSYIYRAFAGPIDLITH